MDPRRSLLSWIEIDADALAHNLRTLRDLLTPGTRFQWVVKANAYGHGLETVVPLAWENDVDWLGVHALSEAERARRAGWTRPLYLLGPTARTRLARIRELGLETVVFDLDTLAALDEVGDPKRPIGVHLKLETGTHRQGILAEDLPAFTRFLERARGVRLAGLAMHFANIEDTTDHGFARKQLARFEELSDPIRRHFADTLRHTACTAAVLTMPETCFDMVRVGIGSYGYWPSRETLVACRARLGHPITLAPALTWKARIGQLRSVPSGSYVGYGCSDRVGRPTRVAVLPIGYSDGYDRGLSRLGHVLVHGRRAPILGRICMNILMADVTDVAEVGDQSEVVLLGAQGDESVHAGDLAEQMQTIPYEVLARLSPTLPRLLTRQGEIVASNGSAGG
ncbi:MAG: alanine racemase [Candidatus Eisenbacteria bacterium]|uniref:Alanine racemase n=1 Tax=Eiseniibacteriota bacterium TaxID=2212470 RepID=A0A956LYE6_UNCEI|nr:alanine racemase [Candidatus Eisenbacteria bacterium]